MPIDMSKYESCFLCKGLGEKNKMSKIQGKWYHRFTQPGYYKSCYNLAREAGKR